MGFIWILIVIGIIGGLIFSIGNIGINSDTDKQDDDSDK